MYKVYFDKRVIIFIVQDDESFPIDDQILFCKSKKSFDKVYKVFLNDLSISQLIIKCKKPKQLFRHFKTRFKQIGAAGGLVLNSKNEYLCIKRNNFWDLPKGKIENSETNKDAAIREVEEECGISGLIIDSKILKTYHTYQLKSQYIFKTTHWYRMRYNGYELLKPQTEEGISEVKWIPKDQIDHIMENTYESLKPIFFFAKSI